MEFTDQFSDHYHELLEGVYEIADRIVLNGYYGFAYTAGGFRQMWRALKGSDEGLDNNHLMRMAGRLSRRLHAFADSEGIPVIHCNARERKHDIALQHIPSSPSFTGLFLILVSRASAPVWDVKEFDNGAIDLKKKYSYVNHYSFHIMDREWGHIMIRMSSHPPFGIMIALNGHEWVQREAKKKGIDVIKEGNCFTSFEKEQELCEIADTLYKKGQLQSVCDRWAYRFLWFGLKPEEQEKAGFFYQYSLFQVELSRNFLFRRGRQLDEVYQNLIDRTRSRIDIKTLKTIFGMKHRPFSRKHKKTSFQVSVERPSYNMTVFKIHDGKTTVKIYDKGERVLRIEVITHNARELKCSRKLDNFPMIAEKLRKILESFIEVLYLSHVSFIDDGELDELSKPSEKGKQRLAGVDINNPRCRNVMKAVLKLAQKPGGFTAGEMAQKFKQIENCSNQGYSSRNAAYDLRKLIGKGMVTKKKHARKYHVTSKGFAQMIAVSVLREKLLKPIVTGIKREEIPNPPKNVTKVDQIYTVIREKIIELCNHYGMAA